MKDFLIIKMYVGGCLLLCAFLQVLTARADSVSSDDKIITNDLVALSLCILLDLLNRYRHHLCSA